MIETPCKNCDLKLKRKDCTDDEFNECMAAFYIHKIGCNRVAEMLGNMHISVSEVKQVAIDIINMIG